MKSIFDSPGFREFWGMHRPPTDKWSTSSVSIRGNLPAVEVSTEATCYSAGNQYKIGLPLPGFKREDIKIEVSQQNLSIKAERAGTILQTKLSISEQLYLPFVADPEKVSATFVDGFLIVTMEKPDSHTPKTVTIQSK